jgi:Flp pilus assembly protein TadB
MNAQLLAILAGGLLAFGLWAVAGALVPTAPRLADALDLLDGRLASAPETSGSGIDRVGNWVRWRLRRPVTADTLRRLRMAGRSVDRHYAYKVLSALAGLLVPPMFGLGLVLSGTTGFEVPAAIGLVAAFVGFFLPDIVLRRSEREVNADATEALLTYFDLVTLERLANSSGSQALRSAAAVSDVAVFATIRDALERARLEQRAPYTELHRLGVELELPALVDAADVMSLDEAGAALSDALRARVRELRDAHLTQAKIAAASVSERMALFMVIPSLVFGLFFLVPPILRLVGG